MSRTPSNLLQQYCLFTCNKSNSERNNNARLRAKPCPWLKVMRGLAYRPYDTKTSEKVTPGGMWWHLNSFQCTAHAGQSILVQSTLTAMGSSWCLKTYLFMEAEKLTVAYPTVQHAIDVDVVGLRERVGKNLNVRRKIVWKEDRRLSEKLKNVSIKKRS